MPIVEDLFLVRGTYHKSDAGKELDTQREVMVSMLFRFVHYYQVLEIFILILQQNFKESEERWKKLSRQIVDTLLPLLGHQQVLKQKIFSLVWFDLNKLRKTYHLK